MRQKLEELVIARKWVDTNLDELSSEQFAERVKKMDDEDLLDEYNRLGELMNLCLSS